MGKFPACSGNLSFSSQTLQKLDVMCYGVVNSPLMLDLTCACFVADGLWKFLIPFFADVIRVQEYTTETTWLGAAVYGQRGHKKSLQLYRVPSWLRNFELHEAVSGQAKKSPLTLNTYTLARTNT